MKLLGVVLGFELGDENDLNSKMETESPASSAKKETDASTTSKPTTTTSSGKAPEPNKTSSANQTPVRSESAELFESLACRVG